MPTTTSCRSSPSRRRRSTAARPASAATRSFAASAMRCGPTLQDKYGVDETRLANVGVGFDRNGKIVIDKDLFTAALDGSPAERAGAVRRHRRQGRRVRRRQDADRGLHEGRRPGRRRAPASGHAGLEDRRSARRARGAARASAARRCSRNSSPPIARCRSSTRRDRRSVSSAANTNCSERHSNGSRNKENDS